MKKHLTSQEVAHAVYEAIPALACDLPADIVAGIIAARAIEENPRAQEVLRQLVENAHTATLDRVPLCQDTGTVWVCLEIGSDVTVGGDVFSGVDAAVAAAYEEARLRRSVVRDAFFDRTNTGDNTPAFCEVHPVDAPGVARLHLMLKGGGSDNASRVVMLTPGAGRQAIFDEVIACVRQKAANACPPLVIGVGIGATFDKVGSLAKHALLRTLDAPAADERTTQLEAQLLEAVNATGIGPGALGGTTTALGVKVNTAPCHIAALPLAINMGCSAMRRVSVELA
ncbi:MAG: fumarate hydratase [Raoultibacter sp.]